MKNEGLDFDTQDVSQLSDGKEMKAKRFWNGVSKKCIRAKRILGAAITMGCTWILNVKNVFAGTGSTKDNPFSFMEGKDNGMFDGLTTTVQESGRSFTGLMLAVGAVALMVILMGIGICFMASKNSNKRDENKSWLIWIIGGSLILFGSGSFGAIIYNAAQSI